jgi:geranylgeranyl pyrophosphate synthase
MHDELAIPVLFAAVYDFIEETVFLPLAWPGFEQTFREYRVSRTSTIHTYVDTLPILTCAAAGGLPDRAIPLAAAWTLYILASKIFDELQDSDGQEDLWNEGGVATALPAGLFVLGAAKASLSHLEEDSSSCTEILGAFGRTMALAARAQREQLPLEALNVESYFKILAAKTGLIFATGAWSGARLATTKPDPKVLNDLYQYGLNTGISGQITDDCLDLGQGDLGNKTFTLPVIYALSQKKHPLHLQLMALLRELEIENGGDHVKEATSILQEMGAIEWSLQVAKAYAGQALAALQRFPKERVRPLVEYAAGSSHVNP